MEIKRETIQNYFKKVTGSCLHATCYVIFVMGVKGVLCGTESKQLH